MDMGDVLSEPEAARGGVRVKVQRITVVRLAIVGPLVLAYLIVFSKALGCW